MSCDVLVNAEACAYSVKSNQRECVCEGGRGLYDVSVSKEKEIILR